jgi:hypothetical protein
MSTDVHRSPNNFGDPTPYLTYALMHVTSAEGFGMFCIDKHERNIDEENNGYVFFKKKSYRSEVLLWELKPALKWD